MINEGSIIFLSRKEGNWYNWRVALTHLIAYFSTPDKDKRSTVPCHTAIIYKNGIDWMVRDMDYDGSSSYTLKEYLRDYVGRIRIKKNPFIFGSFSAAKYNYTCANETVKYDYANLLGLQIVRLIFGSIKRHDTSKRRICAEDTERMFNILVPGTFKDEEESTPAVLDALTRNWEEIDICGTGLYQYRGNSGDS